MGRQHLVLGIDLGTTYFKFGVFDGSGGLRGLGRVRLTKELGDGRLCELPVECFWSSIQEGLAQAVSQADAQVQDIQSLAYSSQANSFLLLDDQGRPLTPLILWPDLRVAEVDASVRRLWDRNDFLHKTGVGLYSPEFCIAKICWLQRFHPDLWSRARYVQSISDYLVFRLTGERVGDEGTASLLGLWDLLGHQWWDEALAAINLSRSQLSRPLPAGTEAGKVTVEGSKLLAFGQGIPLIVGSLDHHVAAIGAGIQGVADLSASLGTVVCCLRYSDEYRPEPDACVGPGTHGHPFYRMTFEGNGTAALDWYCSQHGKGLSFSDLIHTAESVPIGSDGLMARPSADHYGGFQGFCNLQTGHQPGHFVRSIMESAAASLRVSTDRLFRGCTPARVFVTGGGARSEFWPQMIADLLGVEVAVPSCQETACLGAGMLAAVGSSWFDSLAEASQSWSAAGRIFQPELRRQEAYSEWYDLYRKAIS